ncbi:pectate lyase superfamily protein-domain-containing protein [Halteromyces radiatus]|uniref:pectate lyase superfamily protein-domain-containing protein n=1 Tax=Halteromyces radiatus TaxID=101107 RepID=UPI00221E73FD|nr:pectate lyase superfamily protein-domain-containing protein [Halteromyces radiatus]KAI8099725.1 pectate lyase superfamily protein-domain-containing protein [Halteromyces radiatus]
MGSQDNEMWISHITHGKSSFNSNLDYKVYRNVKDYGCIGDGEADDTACINQAIQDGQRCGGNCGSSTLTPALVYFPSGRYKISSPIIMYYFTQLVGNALNPPTLVAANSFQGMAMVDSDPYLADGSQWYINQNNFFRQIRNFVFDLTGTPVQAHTTGLHWQVAQATSLINLRFIMSMDPTTNHQGIWMDNGSGGFMSDLVFEGGKFGMWVGNQQFLSRGLTFHHCQTAIYMNWNWQWTFQKLSINNCNTGIDMTSAGKNTISNVGSILVLDGEFNNTTTGIKLTSTLPTHSDTSATLLLDNVKTTNVDTMIANGHGKVILAGGNTVIRSWGSGSIYTDTGGQGILQRGNLPNAPIKSPSLLSNDGTFHVQSRPQYEQYDVSSFVSVIDGGAKGDGITDDTEAIQKVINDNAGCKIVFFPAGTYIISKTITVPAGSRLTGELWSVLMAKGQVFQDMDKPVAMIKVGNQGDQGIVEMSDLIFSSSGAQPGAVLLEWNMRDEPSALGSSGLWDTHFRVGGTIGSDLQYQQCPKKKGAIADNNMDNIACAGVHTLLRLTSSSSAYLENVWAWTADHDLDDGEKQRQVSIYTGRGILIESTEGPVWLYGVQSEHNTLYQYQISHAKNVLMSMIQSETPYWQPVPAAPFPFQQVSAGDVQNTWNDPTFEHCRTFDSNNSNNNNSSIQPPNRCAMAWGLRSLASSNVYIYGAGLYNFFYDYNQSCLDTEDCQESLVDMEKNHGLYLYNLNTKANINMVVGDNTQVWARQADNVNGFCQTINAFLSEA